MKNIKNNFSFLDFYNLKFYFDTDEETLNLIINDIYNISGILDIEVKLTNT